MDHSTFYTDHWQRIDDDRIARYERMFEWPEGSAALLADADLRPGHRVLDFGAGPGFMALGMANMVGERGQVHGVDINARFVADATARAADRPNVEFHHVLDGGVPLPDGTVDRAIAKNVLEYVPSASATLAELKRVLAPGGRIHLIDSDWGLAVVEPWGKADTERFFGAAAVAFKEPHIGRKLGGLLAREGFRNVAVRIRAHADQAGDALPLLRNMCGYIDAGGAMAVADAEAMLAEAEAAVETGQYLFALPQFVVTADV